MYIFLLGGKGYWHCSGKPCWLWVCNRQRGESLRCCFICTFSDWHPSLPRDEFSTAERLSATCSTKVKRRRFRNLQLKKSSSFKISLIVCELLNNFRFYQNPSESYWDDPRTPWQISWPRGVGRGKKEFTFWRLVLVAMWQVPNIQPQSWRRNFSANRVRQCQQVLWQEKGGGWTYASGISFSAAFD